jgi:hypothetical protein
MTTLASLGVDIGGGVVRPVASGAARRGWCLAQNRALRSVEKNVVPHWSQERRNFIPVMVCDLV